MPTYLTVAAADAGQSAVSVYFSLVAARRLRPAGRAVWRHRIAEDTRSAQ